FLAYIVLTGGSGQASQPISAPTLAVGAPRGKTSANGILFCIVPDGSEGRFKMTEDFFNKEKLVVGRTNQSAGDIFIDSDRPANSQVGTVRVNVRTLMTDSEFRNSALRSRILQSTQPEFEFSEFMPKSLSGLPDKVDVGQEVKFQITGDLKIRDIVQSV